MKLKIENFQSLEGINEFNFEPGVTMIVGASNSGKTAIIRALRGLILNYISSSKAKKYITHFKDNLQVDLQLDDKINYSWYKDTKNTLYKIEDLENHKEQEFEKSGNDDLESICDKAGVDFPFVIRDKKLINTHTEKDSLPFPFDLNDVELFKMFEELYNVSSSGVIFKFMKSLETKTNSEVKSTKEPSLTGTLIAPPLSLPESSGITLPIAVAAPVELGTIFIAQALPRLAAIPFL